MAADPFPGLAEALQRGDIKRAELILKTGMARGGRPIAAAFVHLASLMAKAGQWAPAEQWARVGLQRHPSDEGLLLLAASILSAQRRNAEAIQILAHAAKGGSAALRLRLAQLLVAAGDGARALEQLAGLPPQVEVHRAAAGAHRALGDGPRAVAEIEAALALAPDDAGIWLQRELLASEAGPRAALEVLERALARLPGQPALVQRRVKRLLESGQGAAARAHLEAVLRAEPRCVWALVDLGRASRSIDPQTAIGHFRAALASEPDNVDARMALAHDLARWGGEGSGARLQEACELVSGALPRLQMNSSGLAVEVLWRTGQYEAAESFGDLRTVGRYWAQNGAAEALLNQFARVETDADRLELLEEHRLWAGRLERAAAQRPIPRAQRPPGGKLRLGFLSSDLRGHVVGAFVRPLFESPDERFDLFVYSAYPGPKDEAQAWFEERMSAYRHLPPTDREAAALIAADGLDMLIELGGVTRYSRPGVLAFRPTPRQVSWLGYPHSLGLDAIDGFLADPHMAPAQPELMSETPLLMPKSWICMSPAAFPETLQVDPLAPAERRGFVTFGTANNSYKWSPRVLRTWAKIVAATPDSRFMVLRPEAGSATLQANVARYFADAGVAAERLDFRAVSGVHMPLYNQMDIALDTFPQTGGTTTCEALWMGVPTVTLIGPAVYERLSASILTNAGLGDLVAADEAAYAARAVALASDPRALSTFRQGVRARIAASPLGQTELFARDFNDLIARSLGPDP